jgi:O-antigen ligase
VTAPTINSKIHWIRGRAATLLLLSIPTAVAVANIVPGAASSGWWIAGILSLIAWQSKPPAIERLEAIWLLCLFLIPLAAILSLAQSEDPLMGARRLERHLRFALGIPVFLVLRQKSPITQPTIGTLLSLGAIGSGGVALWQVHSGIDRAHGAVHPILFGDTAILLSCLLVALAVSARGWARLLFLSAALCGLIATNLSLTRNAFLVLPVAGLLAAFLFHRRAQNKLAMGILLTMFFGISLAFVVFPNAAGHSLAGIEEAAAWWRSTPGTASTSLGGRLELWARCVELWQQSPIFGLGTGSYLTELTELTRSRQDPLLDLNPNLATHAHSAYFQSLVAQGLMGFLPLLGVLFLPAVRGWQLAVRAQSKQELTCGLCCLSVAGCFLIFGLGEAWNAKNSFTSLFLLAQTPLMAWTSRTLSDPEFLKRPVELIPEPIPDRSS